MTVKKNKQAVPRVPLSAGLESDPITWEIAAKCLGELLSDIGPDGYYGMTPSQWFLWAADEAKKLRSNV